MQKRNWLELARKLVDQYDMDFTVTALQASLGEYALNYFGFGVLPTALYPTPFPVTMSGIALGGSVGNGIGFDPNGFITRIDTASPTSKNFTITPAHATLPRWDLLVIRYKATGDTPVPKPSDPILTVDLNIHDDFELAVIAGTPNVAPAYPVKGIKDIILMGLKVPQTSTLGTQVTLDMSVIDQATNNVVEQAVFVQEIPTGVIDGINTSFTISQPPASNQSVLVMRSSGVLESNHWSILGQVITLDEAPVIGQDIYVYYIAKSITSINPLVAFQEVPSGVVDGVNDTFYLTGKPAAQNPTIVSVDGRILEATKWSLVQNITQTGVKFSVGNIPDPGQSVYVFYLVNIDTVGAPPPTPGGGGGGGYTVTGSTGVPLSIDPTVGVPVLDGNTDPRQMTFVKSLVGAQIVTANPQIAAGNVVGQELVLVGTSDANYPTLNDGNGVSINGPIDLNKNKNISLSWDGTIWFETGAKR